MMTSGERVLTANELRALYSPDVYKKFQHLWENHPTSTYDEIVNYEQQLRPWLHSGRDEAPDEERPPGEGGGIEPGEPLH